MALDAIGDDNDDKSEQGRLSLAQQKSDPVFGSLGAPKTLLKEIDVDAVVQNDLR